MRSEPRTDPSLCQDKLKRYDWSHINLAAPLFASQMRFLSLWLVRAWLHCALRRGVLWRIL